MNRADVFALVHAERERQMAKWSGGHPWGAGDCSSPAVPPAVKVAVLAEECGEVARAVLDAGPALVNGDAVRRELVQVAAVAVAWLEGMP